MEPQPAVAPSPDSHPRQWAIFTQLDEDGSGTLDLDEIYNYLADMNEGVANELMQALDTNNDGEVDFTVWAHPHARTLRALARHVCHLPAPCHLPPAALGGLYPPHPPLPPPHVLLSWLTLGPKQEFCAGWDTVFFVTGDKKFEDGGDGGGAGDDGGGSLAALTVQRHYRGHQARRELVRTAAALRCCVIVACHMHARPCHVYRRWSPLLLWPSALLPPPVGLPGDAARRPCRGENSERVAGEASAQAAASSGW
jgi:hypothetical protein|eukprot:SAG25_NODE_817_length_5224_cov_27.176780_6_plen_254_part_00